MSPLEAALHRLGREEGHHAFAEAGIPVPMFLRAFVIAQGHFYMTTAALPPEEMRAALEAVERLAEEHGGMAGVWERYCRPRVEAACRLLQEADTDTPLTVLAGAWHYAWMMTMLASLPAWVVVTRLTNLLRETLGDEAVRLAAELASGATNATLDANQALWDLAQLARQAPVVHAALLEADGAGVLDAVRAAPDSEAFLAAFTRYLDRYGVRCEFWDVLSPTWSERPEVPLGLVRRLRVSGAPSPADVVREGIARREALMQETAERLPDNHETRLRFNALVLAATGYVPVREGRAEWQLAAWGSLRLALLRRARKLAAAGVIADPEDIFFLLPDEIEQPAGNLAGLVAERRREWERWGRLTPPSTIGGEGAEPAAAPAPETGLVEPGVIRGVAASRGVVTGRARVAATLDEAEELAPGEVLVCVMTSPPWTPLFGIAAAVVTDTGAPLSHPAIAAREYGIPCVVGTRVATAAIPNGAIVTVDGEQGIVRIEGGAK